MPRMNWEAAAKRDYIREHGSVRAATPYSKSPGRRKKPWQTKTGIRYQARIRPRLDELVQKFQHLDVDEMRKLRPAYLERIEQIADAEAARYIGARTQKIHIAVLEREVKRARGKLQAAGTKSSKPPSVARLRRDLPSSQNAFQANRVALHPVPVKSVLLKDLPTIAIHGEISDGELDLRWARAAEAFAWTLIVRRNKRTIVQETLHDTHWSGSLGRATHDVKATITALTERREPLAAGKVAVKLARVQPQAKKRPRKRRHTR